MNDPIRDSYDAVAAEYDRQISGELADKPLDRGLLAAFADLVPRDLLVGDVGCGPGHVAHHLAGLGCSMVGVDLSPAMIDIARRRYQQIAFQVGSMLDLPAAGRGRGAARCRCTRSSISAPPSGAPPAASWLGWSAPAGS